MLDSFRYLKTMFYAHFATFATFAVELVWYFSTAEFAESVEDSAVTCSGHFNALHMSLIACEIHRAG